MPGSVARQMRSSSVGTEKLTWTLARRAASTSTSTSRLTIGPRVMRENGVRAHAELADARARQAVASLRRLVRVRRRADRDALPLPRRPRELATQHLGDVDLDPDRAAVPVVRRPVGTRLERADVTERAAVGAARVRVQRPVERHALDAVAARFGRAPRGTRRAWCSIEHVFVSVQADESDEMLWLSDAGSTWPLPSPFERHAPPQADAPVRRTPRRPSRRRRSRSSPRRRGRTRRSRGSPRTGRRGAARRGGGGRGRGR